MRRFKLLLLAVAMFFGMMATISLADQNVVVVLDDSGSMRDRMRTESGRVERMDAAKLALLEVLRQLPTDTNVGVLALNTRVDGSPWIVPLGNTDRGQWEANISRIVADGGTPLGEYLKTAADALLAVRGSQVYGTYRMLVVTDGEANDPQLVDIYLPQILARGLMLDVIGVDMTSQHSLAQRAHSYRSAVDDASLKQAIAEVFAETSSNDQDAQEDFELIAGLPDGFAEAVLGSLTQAHDEPLADAGTAEAEEIRNNYNAANPSSSAAESNVEGESLGLVLGGMVCCFGTLLAITLLTVILIGKRTSQRRGRH